MNKSAHLARLFLLDVVERVEIFDLGGEADGKLFDIELLDEVHPALPVHQRSPGVFNRQPDWRYQSQPCHHNATTFQTSHSFKNSDE